MSRYRNVEIDKDTGRLSGETDRYATFGAQWTRFEARLDLLWISEACDRVEGFLPRVYQLQDGYGQPGLVPPQGYDWSGIRDSTPATITLMFAEAVKALPAFWAELKVSLKDSRTS